MGKGRGAQRVSAGLLPVRRRPQKIQQDRLVRADRHVRRRGPMVLLAGAEVLGGEKAVGTVLRGIQDRQDGATLFGVPRLLDPGRNPRTERLNPCDVCRSLKGFQGSVSKGFVPESLGCADHKELIASKPAA
jgi:hypothetical protein